MSETITERFHEAVPDKSFETPEGDNILDIYFGVPADENTNVITYHQRNINIEPFRADFKLMELEKVDLLDPDASYVRNFGHSGDVQNFGNISRHLVLLHALGYRWKSKTDQKEGIEHTWTEFIYPNASSINTVLDEISPGKGLRFASYRGGSYSSVESAEALLDNVALIGEEQPHSVHDHAAFHVLGEIGLVGEYLERIKVFAAPYLRRYNAELELPSVPNMDMHQVQPFLHPSHVVLKSLVCGMDGVTSSIGYNAFIEDPDVAKLSNSPFTLNAVLRAPFDSNSSHVIQLLFNSLSYNEASQAVQEIEDRYDELEAAAA